MKVILFDGVCNLCNGLVNWVIDHDKKNLFSFASLQSNYGQGVVKRLNITGDYMNTFILMDEDEAFFRSGAILRVLKYLGGVYWLAYVFIIVPAFIRNFIYDIIARNRYRWFGKRDSCRVPTSELKLKFLE